MTSERLVGASVWEREMHSHLVDHTRREGAMLAEYVEAANSSESEAFAYVIGLLVADERRHHEFFNQLASSLERSATLGDAKSPIPYLDLERMDRADLIEQTKVLLKHEREDRRELKRLAKELHDVKDTTLWGLLVDVMIRDTDKHIAILKFVLAHSSTSH